MRDLLWFLYPWMQLIGRMLFALIFIVRGIRHLSERQAMITRVQARGVPLSGLLVPVSGLILIAGGLLVALGWSRFIGAGLLFLIFLPAAFVMHPFWKETDPATRASERDHFLKDLSLAGAALLLAVYAGLDWPMSLGG